MFESPSSHPTITKEEQEYIELSTVNTAEVISHQMPFFFKPVIFFSNYNLFVNIFHPIGHARICSLEVHSDLTTCLGDNSRGVRFRLGLVCVTYMRTVVFAGGPSLRGRRGWWFLIH